MLTGAALPTLPRRTDSRRLGSVVAVVVAAHALLLSVPRQAAGTQAGPATPAHALQIRMIDAPRADLLASLPPAMLDGAAPARVSASTSATLPLTAPLPQAQRVEADRAAQLPPVPPAPAWLGVAFAGMPTEDDGFFARSLLTVAPAPLQPVLIDYPSFPGDAGRYVGELLLFIDETGSVVKVRVDGDALPPPLEAAARQAFLHARFRPGEAAELGAVKSRIRIEVTFDGRPRATAGG